MEGNHRDGSTGHKNERTCKDIKNEAAHELDWNGTLTTKLQ